MLINKLFNKPARNNVTVFDDDTFLISYPRSGNTWIRFLLGSIIHKTDVNWKNMEEYVPDIYRNTNKQLKNVPRPRILKSHHPYDYRYPKVIYIVRDVRNVFLSYYKFKMKMNGYSQSIEEFYYDFVHGTLDDFGSWGDNVNSWLDKSECVKGGFLLLKYEDMRSNTIMEVQKILKFLGINRTEDEIIGCIDNASLKKMRSAEKKVSKDIELFKSSDQSIPFVGSGLITPQYDEKTEVLMHKLENIYSITLNSLGYI